jgi:hypothetical protein
MQLIEIIQLALLIFIAISLVIFLFSYLGYRTKSNIEDGKKTKEPDKNVIVSEPEKTDSPKDIVSPKSYNQLTNKIIKFKVFKPSSNDKFISNLRNPKK